MPAGFAFPSLLSITQSFLPLPQFSGHVHVLEGEGSYTILILKRKPAALDAVGSRGVRLFQTLAGDNPLLPSCEAVFSGLKKKG